VDLDKAVIKMLVRKNRRMPEVPLNVTAPTVVNGWFGLRKGEYVFYNPENGGPWKDSGSVSRRPQGWPCRRGVDTFRHTFASRLTRHGADLVTVKELLGHSSVSVTMRYAHTYREAKKRAVRLIAGMEPKLVLCPSRAKIAW
jgi:integrase